MKAGPQRAVQLSALAALGGLALLLAGAVDTQTTPAGPVPRLDLWNNAFRAVKATGPDGRKVF